MRLLEIAVTLAATVVACGTTPATPDGARTSPSSAPPSAPTATTVASAPSVPATPTVAPTSDAATATTATEAAAGGSQRLTVYGVFDVAKRWFVVEPEAPAEAPAQKDVRPFVPDSADSPSYAREGPIGAPRRFTLVGPDGRVCAATAQRRMLATLPARRGSTEPPVWVKALEVEGCNPERGGYRLALPGSAMDALWRDPNAGPTRKDATVQRLPGLEAIDFVLPLPPKGGGERGPLRAQRDGREVGRWPGRALRGLFILRDRRWIAIGDERGRLDMLELRDGEMVGAGD